MKNLIRTIIIFATLIINFSLFGQDSSKVKININSILFPTEVKYIGSTDFEKYRNGISVTKLIFGTNVKKGRLSGDGFNNLFDIGVTYNFINRFNYITIFPQYSGVTWWGAHYYFRSEPLFNLNLQKIEYISAEIGGGLIGSLSLFSWIPVNNSSKLFIGFKFGYYLPLHLKFIER
jgi:hypothetical protein